jgi:predicted nucleic acid-binding protein
LAHVVYFDTSIFLEIAAKKGKYKKHIKTLLQELADERARIYTSIITVQEISVASYRSGTMAKDTYGDVKAVGAKVYGMTKEIALTSAKNEAMLRDIAADEQGKRDKNKPETEDQKLERICENRRRKWDCFHIATAQAMGCPELYTTDENLLKRPTQLGIKNLKALRPGTSLRKISGPLTDHAGQIDV